MSAPQSEAARYAAQVRAALADLPETQRVELLEDLEDHLLEVLAEAGPPLEERLGAPAAYAAELRRAAVDPTPATAPGRLAGAGASLRTEVRRLWELDATREVRAFVPELRPAWWVLRAWLVVAAVGLVFGSVGFLPLGPLVGLPLLVAAVIVSVRLGRSAAVRPAPSPRWSYVANTALAALAVAMVIGVQQGDQSVVYAGDPYGPYGTSEAALTHEDGTPITNLFPYSSDGEPLEGVLLYDQDGRPVDNLSRTDPQGDELRPLVVPGSAPAPSNSFPQEQEVLRHDSETGSVVARPVRPSSPPSASASASPSPSASPSASPSPSDVAPPAPGAPAPAAPPSPGAPRPAPSPSGS